MNEIENSLKILAYPSPGGARQYRLIQIAKHIDRESEDAVMIVSPEGMADGPMSECDVIVLQGTVDPKNISWANAYSKEFGKLLVAELDDYIEITPDHPLYNEHMRLDAPTFTRALLTVADVVTTTTEELATELREYNKNVVILPNCLDFELWGKEPLENDSDEIRIVWAGSSTHEADLLMLKPAIMEILEKYPQAKFLYAGDGNLWKKNLFEKHPRTEYIEPTDLDSWPAKLRSFRADIGVAPLIDTRFNRCKSNLKWLEYSAYKIPSVVSPIVYANYVKDGETALIARTPKEFVKQISRLIEDKQLRKTIGQNAYDVVRRDYDIATKWQNWLQVYKDEYQKKNNPVFEAEVGDTPEEMITKWTKK